MGEERKGKTVIKRGKRRTSLSGEGFSASKKNALSQVEMIAEEEEEGEITSDYLWVVQVVCYVNAES